MYKVRTFSFHWWDSRTPKAEKYLNRVTKLTDEMLKASQSVKSQIYFSVNSLLGNFLNILWLSIIMMSSLPSVLYISLLWLPSPQIHLSKNKCPYSLPGGAFRRDDDVWSLCFVSVVATLTWGFVIYD